MERQRYPTVNHIIIMRRLGFILQPNLRDSDHTFLRRSSTEAELHALIQPTRLAISLTHTTKAILLNYFPFIVSIYDT